jgi:hypothetical protein
MKTLILKFAQLEIIGNPENVKKQD